MAGLEGQTLDRYELEQLTGRGGMADVYRAFDPRFERTVAVKVFKRDDEELLRRFVREARLMASLHHPHLMPVYDTGVSEIDGIPYYFIVMPFMTGGSLRARIRRSPLPLNLACRYLREIADALDYIHSRGIVHRDIKSSNVLLDEDGTCYVADFGIARMENDATQATTTGNVLGTVDYIAPELFESNQRATVSTDLYSLGVLAFEMVTGRLPFTGENQIAVATMHVNKLPPLPRTFVPNLPLPAERVLLRGLEKRPELRYQSATDFADAFCHALSSRATAEIPAEPMWDWDQQETRQVGNQDEQLVLPPVPPVPTAPPAPVSYGNYGSQQAPVSPVTPNSYAQNQQMGYPISPSVQPPSGYPSPQQGLSPERRAGRTRVRIVAVLALLVLLAVIGPIIFFSFNHRLQGNTGTTPTAPATSSGTTPTATATQGATATPTPNLTATAQAIAAATQTAKNATATATTAGATATAQAQASATPGVIQTATAGTPLYQDTLNDPTNNATKLAQWDQNNNCAFQSDGYHMTISTNIFGSGQFKGCHEAGHQYQNAAITVNMSILSGHSGGLFFRLSTPPQALGAYSGYLFEVDNSGRYKVSSSQNFSTGSGDNTLQDWTASSAIKTGNAVTNTLQVIANGNTLLFYVNGTFLIKLQDSSFTSSGTIGFLATTDDKATKANVVYSNLKVYAYPPS